MGIHLVRGHISPGRKCGAQNPDAIRMPDSTSCAHGLRQAVDGLRPATIALEVDDVPLLRPLFLLDYGAYLVGAYPATEVQTRELIEATTAYAKEIGFTKPPQTATHLFNAMPPLPIASGPGA